MNRRDFMCRTVVGGAAATLPVLFVAGEPAACGTEPLRISVLSYAFHGLLREGRMNIFGYLETCKFRYGLHVADIWNGFLESTEKEWKLYSWVDGLRSSHVL